MSRVGITKWWRKLLKFQIKIWLEIVDVCLDPDNEFSWADDSYKKGKDKFQLGY